LCVEYSSEMDGAFHCDSSIQLWRNAAPINNAAQRFYYRKERITKKSHKAHDGFYFLHYTYTL